MSDVRIGNGPPQPPGPDAKPEEWTKYQNDSAQYWFLMNAMQNSQNQNNMSRANMQKANHDALMEIVRNLK